MQSPTFRTTLRAAPLLVLCLGLLLSIPVAATAAVSPTPTGWIRLAHLSPDTKNVDVYLGGFAGGAAPIVLRGIGYGDVSAYESVPVGTYTATVVPAGAGPNAAPILTTSARVDAGRAYTIAGLGAKDYLTGRVLSDDLTPPPTGGARVRLIQGANRAPVVDVTAVQGPTIAEEALFATSTGYAVVPAGRWTLRVQPREGDAQPATSTVELRPGSVSSLLVLDGASGNRLAVRAVADSEGAAVMPTGGVDAGYGPVPDRRTLAGVAAIAGTAAVVGLTVAGIVRWRPGS